MILEGLERLEWIKATLVTREVIKEVMIRIGTVQPGGSGEFLHVPASQASSPEEYSIQAQLSEPVEETKPHETDAKLILPDGRVFKVRVGGAGHTITGKQR